MASTPPGPLKLSQTEIGRDPRMKSQMHGIQTARETSFC